MILPIVWLGIKAYAVALKEPAGRTIIGRNGSFITSMLKRFFIATQIRENTQNSMQMLYIRGL